MNLKWIGAVLIIVACGAIGFAKAAAHRKEEKLLRHLIAGIELMIRELSFRMCSLPELCRIVSEESVGEIQAVFIRLSSELDRQIAPDASLCMRAALESVKTLPKSVYGHLIRLGDCLGRFDMQGQIDCLEGICQQCREDLDKLSLNRDARLRGYQTLGLCAGFALAILLF